MSDPARRDRLDSVEAAVRDLRLRDQINDDTFHKNMVNIAYDHVVNEDLGATVRLIRACGPEYFQDTIRAQMEEDAEFCEVAYIIAQWLLDTGVVDLGPRFNFDQVRPGQA